MKLAWILATIFVIASTLIPALFDGQRRFRWGVDTETNSIADGIKQIPRQLGDWETVSEIELDEAARTQLQPVAYLNRIYFNAVEDKNVHVFILLGPTGPTAVHTPDICFNSRDYESISSKVVTSVNLDESNDSKCFVSKFQSRDRAGEYLKSWYGWTVDGTWVAPKNPRFYFAKSRYLLKIQVVAPYLDPDSIDDDESLNRLVANIEEALRAKVF